jgi:hypothetical protein
MNATLIGLLALTAVILIVIAIFAWQAISPIDRSDSDDQAAIFRRKVWFRFFRGWQFLSWTLSVLIAAGSAFVASSMVDSISATFPTKSFAAMTVAFLAAVQAALNPAQRASAYRQAWIALDLAIKNHKNMPPDLINAIRDGEAFISNIQASSDDHLNRQMPHTRSAPSKPNDA